ncbi:MAG: TAT-variant-translocated molybdopterin oxidoreductase [Saprospiraceae bacterium]|jgi:MoCo/4Fe-4S cofactor protein with predicted Tat translocation signal|nr:TAT-variant-translocated molybdopterin oxidoreductase [Saprospiraceae bacterium]
MKNQSDNIWIGQKDLTRDEEFMQLAEQEFAEEQVSYADMTSNLSGNRRDFLKFLGFGLGAATVAAGCDIPVKRAIPYVVKPDTIVPGIANYYASTFVNGGDYCPVLVKTREGRPIKIEGNDLSSITGGGTSARAQASVLSLYDTNRFSGPKIKDGAGWKDSSWSEMDKLAVTTISASNNIRLVTNTIMSPTAKKAIAEFSAKYPSVKVVTYDPVSASALLDANEQNFGIRAIPSYHFDKADVIVSFNADFLGTWISPIEYAAAYAKGRKINDVTKARMSRHIQVENHMSLSGSNADNRILVKPSEQGVAIAHLYNEITGSGAGANGLNAKAKKALSKVATELKAASGKALVVSASNNVNEQLMVNAINNALGSYGTTIDMGATSNQRQGNDKALKSLVDEIKTGSVDLIIFWGANPVYDSAYSTDLATSLGKVKNKISFAGVNDETTDMCTVVAPAHHFLEAWGDVEAKNGHFTLIQPTIAPLFDTRQAELSLLIWAGSANVDLTKDQPYYEYLKQSWNTSQFKAQNEFSSFQAFWDNAVHDGVFIAGNGGAPSYKSAVIGEVTKPVSAELEISYYETVHMANGQYSGNPWLMEMADPVTRTTWGNYLAVPVNFDGVKTMVGFNDLVDGDLVELTIGKKTVTLPVVQQFGQMPGTVSLALGYGRTLAGNTGTNVGVNVNDSLTVGADGPQYYNTKVTVSNKKGKEKDFSCVQYHHTIGVKGIDKETNTEINADEAALVFFDYFTGVKGFQGALTDRSVIYTANVKELKNSVEHLQKRRKHAQHLNEQQIYGGFDHMYSLGHHWGMHVDLNACIGCGACTVACMSENNVPVVGKHEVAIHHEMTWLRIDRYYYGDVENPNTIYQPMMCQHCDNAPCENVCPVNATNHSAEGLNQMAYNRCIGTRYCANNCPYKVRRFNWLDYTKADIWPANQPRLQQENVPFMADNLTRMVLNPDVTVRSRGVIEKCSFCVQRIQEGKLSAKTEGRLLTDRDVKTACQTSCPTGAITFGDMNDKKGDLTSKLESPLNYIALEEINVRSSVTYTMKVNNRDKSLDA